MRVKEFLLDLDGMLYVGDESVEGAREAKAASPIWRPPASQRPVRSPSTTPVSIRPPPSSSTTADLSDAR